MEIHAKYIFSKARLGTLQWVFIVLKPFPFIKRMNTKRFVALVIPLLILLGGVWYTIIGNRNEYFVSIPIFR